MKHLKFLIIASAVVCISIISYAKAQEKEETKAEHKEHREVMAIVGNDGIQRIELVAGSYFFDPDHIIVKVNVPVEITARKESGVTPHSIVINAPEAGIDIKESLDTEPKVIKFTPKKIGEYPFYCDRRFLFFKSHRARGMEGVLEVIE